MRLRYLLAAGILPVTLVAGCGGSHDDKAAGSQPVSTGIISCANLMSSPLANAAKKEGTVDVTGALTATVENALIPAFEKASGLKVSLTTTRSSELVGKLQTEHAAHIYSYDVYLGGTTT